MTNTRVRSVPPSDDYFWEILTRSATPPPVVAAQEPDEPGPVDEKEAAQRKRRRRRIIRLLDVLSLAIWAVWLVTIFITNVPERAFGSIADYRFFFYIAAIVIGFVALKSKMWLVMGYIVFFPLIVFLWKLPAFFVAHRSWNLFLAITQAAFTVFSSFRYNVITKGLAAFATLIILKSANKGLLLAAGVYFAYLIFGNHSR